MKRYLSVAIKTLAGIFFCFFILELSIPFIQTPLSLIGSFFYSPEDSDMIFFPLQIFFLVLFLLIQGKTYIYENIYTWSKYLSVAWFILMIPHLFNIFFGISFGRLSDIALMPVFVAWYYVSPVYQFLGFHYASEGDFLFSNYPTNQGILVTLVVFQIIFLLPIIYRQVKVVVRDIKSGI